MDFTPDQWVRFGTVVVFAWFAIQIIKLVFDLIRTFTGDKKGDSVGENYVADAIKRVEPQIADLADHVSDLHDWHNVRDPRTGTLVWYSGFQNSALQNTLVDVSNTLQGITVVLTALATQQRENHQDDAVAIKAVADLGKETKTVIERVREDFRKAELEIARKHP